MANQRTFCGGRNLVNAQTSPFYTECTRTIWNTCGLPDSPTGNGVNLFDNTLCGGDEYDAARGLACMAGQVPSSITPAPNCGDETDSNSYVYAYCDSDVGLTNFRDCPVAYARKNPVVSTVSLADFIRTGKNQPLNSDGTAPLTTIVASGGASLADTDANLITGGADSLDLGLADNKTINRGRFVLSRIGIHHDSDSGFAIAGGLIDNGGTDVYKQYVGLLSGTDLGAPLRDDAHSGRWDAKVFIRVSVSEAGNHNILIHQDFKLDVNFRAKTLTSFYTRNDGGGSILYFNDSDSEFLRHPQFRIVNGKFTANGVIYGTVRLYAGQSNSLGTLTGLIGQDGAVGIFASNDNRQADYVGGFVAKPRALTQNFAKWVDSFDAGGVNAAETLQSSGFSNSARISADFIKLDRTDKILIHGRALDTTVVRLNETPGRDGYESGFAYAYSDTSLLQLYVGLLPATDVGRSLPLISSPINTVWTGRIAGTVAETDFSNDNFHLNISYGSGGGKITTPIFGDAYYYSLNSFKFFGSPTVLPIPAGGRNTIAVNGTFNSNGVISGNVGFNSGSTENGTLTGLIGQSGAVAVFNGAFSNLYTGFFKIPYAGGFAIAPKSCIVAGNCVGFGTWENSFVPGRANGDNTLRAAGYQASAGASAEYIKLGRADRINEIPIIIPGGNKVGDTATAKTLRLNNIHEGGYESGVVFAHEFDRTASPFIAQIYAGMLPTTNLGAPLTDNAKNGTWTGTLEGYDGTGE